MIFFYPTKLNKKDGSEIASISEIRRKSAIATFLIGVGILLSPQAASAFEFRLIDITPDQNLPGGNVYRYTLKYRPNESFAPGDELTLSNLTGVYNATVAGGASNFFSSPTFTSQQVTWTAIRDSMPIAPVTTSTNFRVFSTAPRGTVNWSLNGGIGNPTSGTAAGPAPVPEPMTTLFASTVALGFGGWLKREQSKLQKKPKDKVTT